LKKKEINDKMKRLRNVAGDEHLAVNIDDLDADFDPKEYDRRMQELFNDDYYKQGQDEKEKPELLSDEEELQVENWDRPPVTETISETKTTTKKSKLSQAISQTKPVFDPKEKTFEQYFDEYYKLDCEDIIGNMPVRFQYRKVIPNDFGLTIDEILQADDRELNAWCSLKKTSQYRTNEDEIHDQYIYRNKGKNFEKKTKNFLKYLSKNK